MTTDFSPFAPPTLGDVPAGAAPPPPPIIPSLPEPGPGPLPSLAPPAAPPHAVTPPSPRIAPTTPTTTGPPPNPAADEPVPNQPSAPHKRSRLPVLLLLLLVIATIAGAAWFAVGTSDDAVRPATPAPSNGLDIEPQDVSSPIVEPIDDAREVVVDIDDNGEEAEALDLLGLDETGNPVTDSGPVPGHSFTWSYGTDDTVTITVDSTTGDYAFVSSDGTEWRRVDGRSYGRRSDVGWAEVDTDAVESVKRLGIDGPLTVDQVIDDVTAQFTAVVTSETGDDTTEVSAEIDATAYGSGRPDDFTALVSRLGHPTTTPAPQLGDTLSIELTVGADGRTVEQLTFTTAAFTTTYTLDEVFETAPAIEAPEV